MGAVLITVLLEVFREFGAFRLVNFSVLLVLIMIYRPQGLMGCLDEASSAADEPQKQRLARST